MDYQNFIGKPVEFVKNELKRNKVSYIIEELNFSQKKYDEVLVVKVEEIDNGLKLITDKFLLKV